MKTYKFRAWDMYNRKMIDLGDLETIALGLNSDFANYQVMQWTGLVDKNGTEIFENDFIHNYFINVNGVDNGDIWLVKFGEYDNSDLEYGSLGYGFYCENKEKQQESILEIATNEPSHNATDMSGIEVIGNIHQNLELLEGGKYV